MPLAFLSYASADRITAKRISDDLLSCGVSVWLDEWEISVGECIPSRIQEGMQDSRFVMVALSVSSVRSPWVDREWKSAYWDEIEKRQIVVMPLLLEECEIPLLLRTRKYADFSRSHSAGIEQVVRSVRRYLREDASRDFFAQIPAVAAQLLETDPLAPIRNLHWDTFVSTMETLSAEDRFLVQRNNMIYYLDKWGLTVRQLRTMLRILGFSLEARSDSLDQKLIDALVAFQKLHCLRHIDGVFGPLTYSKMHEVWTHAQPRGG